MQLPDQPLVHLVQELLTTDQGRAALANNDFLPLTSPVPAKLRPEDTTTEIIEVLQLICAGAAVACPIINGM
jgi:hypothetical protein